MNAATQRFSESSGQLYNPLRKNEFRLLRVLPGSGSDFVQCLLSTHDIQKAPQYSALSYEWGNDEDDTATIQVSGSEFRIRRNLHEFLVQLRITELEVVWADAICINQADLGERSEQVGLMATIYTAAICTHAWLGPADCRSDEIMSLLADWHHAQSLDMSEGQSRVPSTTSLFGALFENDLCTAFIDLVQRSYWTRLWIMQEVILAREVVAHCGSRRIPITALGAPLNFQIRSIDGRGWSHVPSYYTLCGFNNLAEVDPQELDIAEQLPTSDTDMPLIRERPFPLYAPSTAIDKATNMLNPRAICATISRLPRAALWNLEILGPELGSERSGNFDDHVTADTAHKRHTIHSRGLCGVTSLYVPQSKEEVLSVKLGHDRPVEDLLRALLLCHPDMQKIQLRRYLYSRWLGAQSTTLTSHFDTVLTDSQGLKCKNVSDHIFGLLALLEPRNDLPVKPQRPSYNMQLSELLLSAVNCFTSLDFTRLMNLLMETRDVCDFAYSDGFLAKQRGLHLTQQFATVIYVSGRMHRVRALEPTGSQPGQMQLLRINIQPVYKDTEDGDEEAESKDKEHKADWSDSFCFTRELPDPKDMCVFTLLGYAPVEIVVLAVLSAAVIYPESDQVGTACSSNNVGTPRTQAYACSQGTTPDSRPSQRTRSALYRCFGIAVHVSDESIAPAAKTLELEQLLTALSDYLPGMEVWPGPIVTDAYNDHTKTATLSVPFVGEWDFYKTLFSVRKQWDPRR